MFLSLVFQASGYELESLIIRPALELVGSSYASGAVGPDRFDCSGFVNYLYKPYLKTLPRTSRDMAGTGRPVDRSALIPGDLVFFATGSSPGRVTHVAIYIGQNSLVHAISNGPERGVVITGLSSRYWDRRYHSSRRVLSDSFNRASEKVEDRSSSAGSYSGAVVQGEPEGDGVLRFANGDRYEGEFGSGFPEGTGEYRWKNGDLYRGEFRRGTLHGEGTLRFSDGTEIKALWNEGRLVTRQGPPVSGAAARMRAGSLVPTHYQVHDSPWDSFNGIVEGDYELWRKSEEKNFEAWKKENQPGG